MASQETIFMFPGEGCQYFQMGRPLFEQHPRFRECMQQMDSVVQDLSGYSVLRTLYDRGYTPAKTFNRTLLSHPAIFMVEYATARVLIEAGVEPHTTLGTSLGSFAAAAVAGCISIEQALAALVRQAAMIEVGCQRGGMIAILHNPDLYEREELRHCSEIAAINRPTHFVLSALESDIARIERFLRAQRIRFQRLPVSFAFHSRWIDEAKLPFQQFLRSLRYRAANIPLVCSVAGSELDVLPLNYLWKVVREPVRLHKAIAYLEANGPYRYVDVGPMPALSTLVNFLLDSNSDSSIRLTLSPLGSDLENIAALVAETT